MEGAATTKIRKSRSPTAMPKRTSDDVPRRPCDIPSRLYAGRTRSKWRYTARSLRTIPRLLQPCILHVDLAQGRTWPAHKLYDLTTKWGFIHGFWAKPPQAFGCG